ncbi:hypothetical protein BD780_001197 [Clostridium tetanomorphum]|uniref:DUF1266 domain-containing protein n=1 Tax=Clostridium tetanomorphum TaxID=1553 RepID=A0A923E7K5_CLOTT|nr:DUF1266 domain-containing protein [Clostridium tetanomorphum]KAJ52368.1 hypothetical protein CTM_07716 [Clostridium tetanomorphum DSM 665]MBC2397888.1 DUF1266 domain-containing protein [Clostridium tetanomorphum]MBP1864796.1 hypothetical protein [Clostridium tetanomorphum]NRS83972.1 hypothetical protein [Clostridium tetanomorphum]NRZ97191.1 hypothetical protein [Clostridium tetanomorphum]
MGKSFIDKEINKSCGKSALINICVIVAILGVTFFVPNSKYENIIHMVKEFIGNGLPQLKDIKKVYLIMYSLFFIIFLISTFFLIKSFWHFINKKQHFMYRQLRQLGDEDRLKDIIQRETSENAFFEKIGNNYITSNWFIFNIGFNYVLIPYNMLVWIYKKKRRSLYDLFFRKSYSIEIYLLNGKEYSIPVNKNEADLIIESVKVKLPMLNTKRTIITWLEWVEERGNIKKKWKNIICNNGNIYFYLQDESLKNIDGYELNQVLEFRQKVLEKIREISLIVHDEEVILTECIILRNGIIMFPAEEFFEAIGGMVEEDEDEDNCLMVNIYGKNIYLDGNNKEIFINGRQYSLNTPITLEDDVIYVPSEVITELLNQKLIWDEKNSIIKLIKAPEKYTKEQLHWGYAVGAILAEYNDQEIDLLGGSARDEESIEESREGLSEWWGIEDRDDLLDTIEELKNGLHNKIFMDIKNRIDHLNDEEFKEEMNSFPNPEHKRDLEVIRKYSKEVGQVGILGWDLSRLISITGWGYISGYLDYNEANDIIMETARVVQRKFSSWEQIGKNYLIGYEYWSGDSPKDITGGLFMRNQIYKCLIKDSESPYNTLDWNLNLNPR